MAVEEQAPVVVLDFLGVERSACDGRDEERAAGRRQAASASPLLENGGCFPAVAMSLRTREASSIALKRIFDRINSTAEGTSQPPDSTLSKRMSFLQTKDADEKRGESLTSQTRHAIMADKAWESSAQREVSDELLDNDAEQEAKGMRPWNHPQEAPKLLGLGSYADASCLGSEDRTESNGQSSAGLAADRNTPRASAFCPMRQEQESSSYGNRVLGLQIPDWKAVIAGGGKHRQLLTNVMETGIVSTYPFTGHGEAHPQSLEHSRKRGIDLDLSFRKAQTQDALTILSQQTAFGSPISLSSFRSDHRDAVSVPSEWPTLGFYPVTGVASGVDALSSRSPGRQLGAQLTIFYSGMVTVYDDVPADKAQAIMLLAGTGNSWTAPYMSSTPSGDNTAPLVTSEMVNTSIALNAAMGNGSMPVVQNSHMGPTPAVSAMPPTFSTSPTSTVSSSKSPEIKQATLSSAEIKQPQNQQPAKRSYIELPYARKASLARFLEKRKDRVQSRSSDMVNKEDPVGAVSEAEMLPSPKKFCSRSPSPCPTFRPQCGSSSPIQCVGEDQTSITHTPTSKRVL